MALLDCHAHCVDPTLPQPAWLLNIELDQPLVDQYLVKRLTFVLDDILRLTLLLRLVPSVKCLIKFLRLTLPSLLDLAFGLSVDLGLHHRYVIEELEEGLAKEEVSSDLLEAELELEGVDTADGDRALSVSVVLASVEFARNEVHCEVVGLQEVEARGHEGGPEVVEGLLLGEDLQLAHFNVDLTVLSLQDRFDESTITVQSLDVLVL